MKILVVSSVHLPDDARIVRQLQSLVEGGHSCALLAPWADSRRTYAFEKRFFPREPGFRGRLTAYVRFLKTALLEPWDVIHYHDFDLCPCAMLVRLITGRSVVYDVHENYAEEVMVRAYIPNEIRRWLKWCVIGIEWLTTKIVGRVVVVVPCQVDRFGRWGCASVTLVSNFAPRSFAPTQPISGGEPRDKHYVLNTGSQTVDYGARLVLDAAVELKARGAGIPIIGIDRFEGSPGLRESVLEAIDRFAPRYKLMPRVPPQELFRYMENALIGLSVMLDTPNKRIAYPTKLFEYMAYGIPIIATEVGYQAEIIRASGAGILVPANDPGALADAIASLWKDTKERARLGAAGRRAFFNSYCWELQGERLLRLYRGIYFCSAAKPV